LTMVPDKPATVMVEGYGVAVPGTVLAPVPVASLMVIGVVFSKVLVVCATAATVKTARIKNKLLKKDKIFIFLLEKLKTKKCCSIYGFRYIQKYSFTGELNLQNTRIRKITLFTSSLSMSFSNENKAVSLNFDFLLP